MRIFSWITVLIFVNSAWADSFTSRVHSVVKTDHSALQIRFENGRVAFAHPRKLKSLDWQGELVQVRLGDDYALESIRTIPSRELKNLNPALFQDGRPIFEATVLNSLDELQQMFNRMKPDYKRISECSDRAQVWAYEEFKKSGLKSEKAFVFFTASYINRHRFKWWFHVAPLISVKSGARVQKMVMDYRYLDRPVPIKEWTDLMVFSKKNCKLTEKFSEYDVNPQIEDCYLMVDSMYYRLPGELHSQELTQKFKAEFSMSEIQNAYRNAFLSGEGN
jgi:hypothetical protein